jgi:hypothetical protein
MRCIVLFFVAIPSSVGVVQQTLEQATFIIPHTLFIMQDTALVVNLRWLNWKSMGL